jgi:hypothetical protein
MKNNYSVEIATNFFFQDNAIDCGVYCAYNALFHAYGLYMQDANKIPLPQTTIETIRMAILGVTYFTFIYPVKPE